VWNQIEGAMTLQANHPLLLLHEEGMFLEGIFKSSFMPSYAFSPPCLNETTQTNIANWLILLERDSGILEAAAR
jgi:hypothetical protein